VLEVDADELGAAEGAGEADGEQGRDRAARA
jgi:hypothetical protein